MTFVAPLGLGEEVIGRIPHPTVDTRPLPAAARVRGRRAILTCTACALHEGCRGPVPWSGPAPNPLLVIGEAPGANEDVQGAPFVGVSGQLLRQTLARVGIPPDLLTFANTVCCKPNLTPPTPKKDHIDACAPNLARTLRIVAPSHALLVGAIALTRFRPDLRITTARGRPFTVPSPCAPASSGAPLWCFPVVHPASILRDRSQEPAWREDLARWARIISSTAPTDHLPITCVLCKAEVHRYDPDGVAWCETHHPKGEAGWKASNKKRAWMLRAESLTEQHIVDVPRPIEPPTKPADPT